jgi:uncharacterized OsmC-like protein
VHLKSGSIIETDAPTDNNGKGERFSPTDLVATALCSCMLTVIGIHFEKKGIHIKDIHFEVQKVMASNPRRIDEILINFDFGANQFSEKEFQIIHKVADSCPVANSLSKDIKITTNLGSFYSL